MFLIPFSVNAPVLSCGTTGLTDHRRGLTQDARSAASSGNPGNAGFSTLTASGPNTRGCGLGHSETLRAQSTGARG